MAEEPKTEGTKTYDLDTINAEISIAIEVADQARSKLVVALMQAKESRAEAMSSYDRALLLMRARGILFGVQIADHLLWGGSDRPNDNRLPSSVNDV